MKHPGLTPIALVPLLMATFSLVSMIGLLQIDKIVHGTLYSYGLEFSNTWARPYWQMTALIFVMGWFNIISALVFQAYVVTFERRQARRFADAVRDEVMRTRIRAVEMIRESRQEEPTVPSPVPTPEAAEEKRSETDTVAQQDSSETVEAATTAGQQAEQTEQPEEQQTQSQQKETEPEPPHAEPQQVETKPETTEKKEGTPIIVGIPAEELNASQ